MKVVRNTDSYPRRRYGGSNGIEFAFGEESKEFPEDAATVSRIESLVDRFDVLEITDSDIETEADEIVEEMED